MTDPAPAPDASPANRGTDPSPVAGPATAVDERNDPAHNPILRYQQGDESAFEAMVERYGRPVHNFIYRMVGSTADADELSQETWVRVLRAIDRYEPRAKVLTWLLQIARNLCLDHFKRMSLRQHPSLQLEVGAQTGEGRATLGDLLPDPKGEAPIDPAVETERNLMLEQAIQQLSEKKREAIVLRVFHDLPYDEIAELTSTPSGTIKYRVHDAIQDLRRLLSESANPNG